MKLSFCIPTYNRKSYLEEVLKSIFSQKREGFNVVISDNHSIDGTEEMIRAMHTQYPEILYHRWEQTVPCGENLLKAVELGTGEYCWLMTDDDRVEQGAIEHVLNLLHQYPGVTGISVNVEGYDRELSKHKKIRYSHQMTSDHLFTQAEDAFERLGAWIGFWSAQIVRKALWNEMVQHKKHNVFLGYHHLYLILAMIKSNPCWLFTDQKCVGYRADNESFFQEYGRLKRFEIDAFSYTTIGKQLFSLSSVKKVNKIVIKKLLFWQLVTVKCEKPSLDLLNNLTRVAFQYYRSYVLFWCLLLPLLWIPNVCLRYARAIYRICKR